MSPDRAATSAKTKSKTSRCGGAATQPLVGFANLH
jgi:hypothetical protein